MWDVGYGIRCQIFDNSDCSNSATVEAESLGSNLGLIGTVLGHAAVSTTPTRNGATTIHKSSQWSYHC